MGLCASGEELSLGFCYPACRSGYNGTGPICAAPCPNGTTDAGITCVKDTYFRGTGTLPGCPSDKEYQAGLCYTKCRDGFHGFVTICSRNCPDGFRDDGLYCRKPSDYGRGTGYGLLNGWKEACEKSDDPGAKQYGCEQWTGAFPLTDFWYPKCAPGFRNVGCCFCTPVCPNNWDDIGISCRKPDTYDRGAGTSAQQCPADQDNIAGLCYPKCRPGYQGVALNCETICPSGTDRGLFCEKPIYNRGVGSLPSVANLVKQYLWIFVGIGILLFLIILAIAYFVFRPLFT
jgi:hypothetical protein